MKQNQQTVQRTANKMARQTTPLRFYSKTHGWERKKFTDFFSRNLTENPELKKNYEKEFVINAIAQLATVNARIGRVFNQLEAESTNNETNMHDTRTLIDTPRYQTNKSHTDFNYHSLQSLENEITMNHPE